MCHRQRCSRRMIHPACETSWLNKVMKNKRNKWPLQQRSRLELYSHLAVTTEVSSALRAKSHLYLLCE